MKCWACLFTFVGNNSPTPTTNVRDATYTINGTAVCTEHAVNRAMEDWIVARSGNYR